MADPFNKFMAYKDNVSKQLEDVCGHYVESKSSCTDLDLNWSADEGGEGIHSRPGPFHHFTHALWRWKHNEHFVAYNLYVLNVTLISN